MRSIRLHPIPIPIAAALCVLLAACGSGGGDDDTPAAAAVEGTVATGAAYDGAQVRIVDRTGADACTVTPLVADAKGAFRCELKPAAAAPVALIATDARGLRDPLVSLAASLPGVGSAATVNISPLTTAIVAQLAPNKDAFALVDDPAALAAVDAAALQAVRRNVTLQLADVLRSVGLDPARFDPIATPFVGGSNTGADQLLDQVRVQFENGVPMLANVLAPTAAPVPMANAATTTPQMVAVSAAGSFSVTELDIVRTAFEACFAAPAATRADSDACSGLLVDDAPAARTGGATYLHNGFDGSGAFSALLSSTDMDGARFDRPELLRYQTRTDGDQAVVNVRFADKNGVGDNRILVLKKFAGTATTARNSDWWLYGNQRPVNAYVRASIRKQEQFLPEAFRAQYNTGASRFQTGLEIYVARPGWGPSLGALRYVRVKGPGLPTAGLVLAPPDNLPQSWMSIHNAKGVVPQDLQYGSGSSNIFYLQRSQGISGADAFALRTNPSVGQATAPNNNWAHPTMYGEAPRADWQFDLGQVPAWSSYTLELFTAASDAAPTDTTPAMTFNVSTVTPVVPAAYAATQPWHTPTAASRALVTDGAAAATSLTFDWQVDPYAQRIESVNAYSFDGATGLTVNSASTSVPKGATSRTVTAVGGSFPALTTSHYVSRMLQWRYKVLDGSYKDETLTFN